MTEAEHEARLDTLTGYDRDWLGQTLPWVEADDAGRMWAVFTVTTPRRGHLPPGRHRHEWYGGAYDPKRPLTCGACNATVAA